MDCGDFPILEGEGWGVGEEIMRGRGGSGDEGEDGEE